MTNTLRKINSGLHTGLFLNALQLLRSLKKNPTQSFFHVRPIHFVKTLLLHWVHSLKWRKKVIWSLECLFYFDQSSCKICSCLVAVRSCGSRGCRAPSPPLNTNPMTVYNPCIQYCLSLKKNRFINSEAQFQWFEVFMCDLTFKQVLKIYIYIYLFHYQYKWRLKKLHNDEYSALISIWGRYQGYEFSFK